MSLNYPMLLASVLIFGIGSYTSLVLAHIALHSRDAGEQDWGLLFVSFSILVLVIFVSMNMVASALGWPTTNQRVG